MGLIEAEDLNFLYKKNGKLKKIGKEEIYMESIPQKAYASAIMISFGNGSLEEKVKKLRKLDVKGVKIIGSKSYENNQKFKSLNLSNPEYNISKKQFREIIDYM